MGMFGNLFSGGGGSYNAANLRDQAYMPPFNPMGTPINGAPQDVPIGITGQMPQRDPYAGPTFTRPTGMFGSSSQPSSFMSKLGTAGALLSNLGGNPNAINGLRQQQQFEIEQRRLDAQNARDDARLNKPQFHFGEDGSAYQIDPTTGKFTVLAQGTGKQGSVETNYNFYNKIDPTGGLARQYASQEAAGPPVMQVVNGQLVAIPRTVGAGASAGGSAPAPVTSQAQYNALPPGSSYTAPDGSHRIKGGASPSSGSGTFPDPMKAPGTMTSGRRTVPGNAAVGGVPNSHHLDGSAADYVGASPSALAAYFGPSARILDEGNHVHVTLPNFHGVPLYGRRGTM